MAECGTRQAYRKGCRCEACTLAGQGMLAERRAREAKHRARQRAARANNQPIVKTHGASGFGRGCRCPVCVTDKRDLDIARRGVFEPIDWTTVAHLLPGAGVRRRTP